MITYYLFIDNEFCIYNLFDNLRATRIIEPGLDYIMIKENDIVEKYIVIESIYKDEYFKNCLTNLLRDIGYDTEFKILKPLVI